MVNYYFWEADPNTGPPHNGQLLAKRRKNSQLTKNFVPGSLAPKQDFFVKIIFS